MKRKIYGLLVLIASIIVIIKTHYYYTDGFRINKITKRSSYEVSNDSKYSEEIDKILDQEFYYLDKGNQAYVFESNDKNYVIKFIRFTKYQKSKFYSLNKKVLEEKENRRFLALNSYKIAYENLKTNVVYIHLNKSSHFSKPLILRDKLRRRLSVDLNKVGFIIQRKITPLDTHLQNLKAHYKQREIKRIITSVLEHIVTNIHDNVFNKDKSKNFIHNLGYYEDRIVTLDIGSFYTSNDKNKDAEIYETAKAFRLYLEENFNDLLTFYDEQLEYIQKHIEAL